MPATAAPCKTAPPFHLGPDTYCSLCPVKGEASLRSGKRFNQMHNKSAAYRLNRTRLVTPVPETKKPVDQTTGFFHVIRPERKDGGRSWNRTRRESPRGSYSPLPHLAAYRPLSGVNNAGCAGRQAQTAEISAQSLQTAVPPVFPLHPPAPLPILGPNPAQR